MYIIYSVKGKIFVNNERINKSRFKQKNVLLGKRDKKIDTEKTNIIQYRRKYVEKNKKSEGKDPEKL